MPDVDEFYKKVSDIYSKTEFKEKIQEKKEELDHFFDENTLAHMIVADEGRNESAIHDIDQITPGDEATVQGEIIDLGSLRTFQNENGEGRVRNIRIDDGTGTIKVVFWNDDTDRVEEEFEIGSKIKVINGYVQDRGYGKQISAGKWGEISLVEEGKKD